MLVGRDAVEFDVSARDPTSDPESLTKGLWA